MKANELRIGNLCQDKISGAQLKVTGLKENDISFYVIDRNLFPLQPGWQAEPIPLTEEWLLKLGFEHFNDTGWSISHKKIYFILSYSLSKNIVTIETDEEAWAHIYNIKYVHQLQNLYFALTGEELKLKEDESKTD